MRFDDVYGIGGASSGPFVVLLAFLVDHVRLFAVLYGVQFLMRFYGLVCLVYGLLTVL